jgi:hypothetical protein
MADNWVVLSEIRGEDLRDSERSVTLGIRTLKEVANSCHIKLKGDT